MLRYQPHPIDTSKIQLSDSLKALTERLAENAHDLWAQQRTKDGWTYGPERNDTKKTHPGLVPYDQLTETEKEYDRITAMESLKAILAIGYTIQPAVK